MKIFSKILLLLFVVSCFSQDQSEELQKELFPYLRENANEGSKKCDLSFVKIHDEELSIYCLPVKSEDPAYDSEHKEWARSEVEKLTIKWAQSKNLNFKSLRVRFTDEIATESKK